MNPVKKNPKRNWITAYSGRLRKATTVLFIVAIASGIVYAAYVQRNTVKEYFAGAEKNFHFCSDLLSCQAEVPVYNVRSDFQNSSEALCSFRVQNFCDELNVSAPSLMYEIFVYIPGLGEKKYGDGSMSGETPKQTTYDISLSDLVALGYPAGELTSGDHLQLRITASSFWPYRRHLKGTFMIYPAEATLTYSMADNAGEPVARLRIAVEPGDDLQKNVTIAWSNGAVPDLTNPLFAGVTASELQAKSRAVPLNTAATYEIVFFKDNPATNYTGATAALQ